MQNVQRIAVEENLRRNSAIKYRAASCTRELGHRPRWVESGRSILRRVTGHRTLTLLIAGARYRQLRDDIITAAVGS